jgi:hypothetical protein
MCVLIFVLYCGQARTLPFFLSFHHPTPTPTSPFTSPNTIHQTKPQAYYILDELFIGGQLQETSKHEVLRVRF